MIISSAKVLYFFLSTKFNPLFVIYFFVFFVNLLKIVVYCKYFSYFCSENGIL